jgi:hypothetical protein
LRRVLHGFGALAKPGAKHQTQEGVAGWPDFEPDFAEEPGLIEPYLSAIQGRIHSGIAPEAFFLCAAAAGPLF